MPSTPSPLLKLELQATGENLAVWGEKLNGLFSSVEQAGWSVLSLTITGDQTLTADNYVANEYRRGAHILLPGGGLSAPFAITVPPVSYVYRWDNRTAYPATIKTASGVSAIVRPGQVSFVICDGKDCKVQDPTLDQVKAPANPVSMNGQRLTSLGATGADTDAISRGEVNTLTAASVQLASDWAQKTSAAVDGTEYSAKLWATSTTALTGGNKGAKGYALDASGSATAASTSAGNASTSATNAGTSAINAANTLADFLNRYVVASGFPTTGNFDGRIAYSTTQQAFGVYKTSLGTYSTITVPSAATTTTAGIIQIATTAQAQAGTDTTTAVTPAGTNAAIAAAITASGGSFRPPDFIAEDQKPSGTSGGAGGSAGYQPRTLNTVVKNSISGASLSASIITLPAGSYYCETDAPAVGAAGNKVRLYNITDSIALIIGSSEFGAVTTTIPTRSYGFGIFTMSSAKTLRIEQYRSDPSATDSLGRASTSGDVEVYSRIRIWKTA